MTTFGLYRQARKHSRVVETTVGTGEPGLKTRALRADRSAIEKSGLVYPDNAAFTPRFFGRFLAASGALDARDSEEAKRRIMSAQFTGEEKDATAGAIERFPLELRRCLVVRSDEYPAGIGLGHSGISIAASGDEINLRTQTEQVGTQMKRVLAKDFTPDMTVFKARKGLTEGAGVLVTPFAGELGFHNGDKGYITNLMRISWLSGLRNALIQVSGGIGAAAEFDPPRAKTFLAEGVPLHEIFLNKAFFGYLFGSVSGMDVLSGERILIDQRDRIAFLRDIFAIAPSIFTILNRQLEMLLEQTGPRYLELALDDSERFSFAVVQSAPVTPVRIEPPDCPGKVCGMDPLFVLGTKIVESGKIRYNRGTTPDRDQQRFNAENPQGYVLVVTLDKCTQFLEWGLSVLSNATSIVLDVGDSLNPVASHLGGLYRELGIPVLVGWLNRDLKRSLEKEPVQKRASTTYANEFKSEGIFAVEE